MLPLRQRDEVAAYPLEIAVDPRLGNDAFDAVNGGAVAVRGKPRPRSV